MPNNNETTTKFSVDISDFKKGLQDAKRQIRLANAEFKSATSELDNWSKSTDGVSSKITQLEKVLKSQTDVLDILEAQYKEVVAAEGETSTGAQELQIKIENQRAAIGKTNKDLANYKTTLSQLTSEQDQNTSETKDQISTYDKLQKTIADQESELKALKKQYSNIVLEQGENSQSATELARKIQNLSSDLNDNKTALKDADKASDKLDNSLDDLSQSAENAGDGFTIMKGAIADLVADGIKTLAGALKDQLVDALSAPDQAFNNFQSQTGTSADAMEDFKKEIKDLYANNYGESLDDVADAMGRVKQQFKETDPTVLSDITKKALVLRDTFDADLNETIRGANNLMTHFGLSADEAFDLIAKGSQNGLNYTDELGDNIAEYGGNFEQAGYSADEYFQLLENGVKGGAYNLDKVNDSINEIKNRLGDGTIEKNLNMFGNGTKLAFKNWQKGKGTMKDVINSIVKDISNCTNEQNALNMAATAFGTMGEDANLNVVKSLTTLGDSYKNVKGTMDEIDKIKYDDLKNQFIQIGRTIQTDFVFPLAQKAMPTIQKFTDYITTHMDRVIDSFKVVGTTIATVFVTTKIAAFSTTVLKLASGLIGLTSATTAAANAQKLLNLAQIASPIGAVIAAVTALIGVLAVVSINTQKNKKDWSELTEEEQANKDSVDDLKKSYDELKASKDKTVADANIEYGYYQQLANELDTIVDKNGKIKKGYEERAAFITSTLSDATGEEISIVDGVVQKYDNLKSKIEELIQTKKAKIILDANEDAYTEAITNQTTAFTNLTEAQNNLKTTQEALTKAEEDAKNKKEALNNAMSTFGTETASGRQKIMEYAEASQKAQEKVDGLTKKQKDQQKTVTDAQTTWSNYNSTIKNYEGLSSAIVSGDQTKIENALNKLVNNFITAKDGTRKQLEQQVKDMRKNYDDLKAALKAKTPGVTQEMVKGAKDMVDKSEKELNKYQSKAEKSAETAMSKYNTGLNSKIPIVNKTTKDIVDTMVKGLESQDTTKSGKKEGQEFADGIASKKETAKTKGKDVSKKAKEGLEETKAKTSGTNFVQGFIDGINDNTKSNSLLGAVTTLGKNALKWFNKALDEHSPSKETEKSGKYFTEGFVNGIDSQLSKVEKSVINLANSSLKPLMAAKNNDSYEKAGEKVISNFEKGIAKQTSQVEKTTNKVINKVVNSIKKHVKKSETKNAVQKAGETLANTFTSKFEKSVNKAVTKSVKNIDKITTKFQTAIDAVNDKKSALNETLNGYGDLFTTDDDGNLILSNLKAQTADIKTFGKNLETLKAKISDGLMNEILGMDAETGAKFAQALVNLSPKELKAYDDAYKEKAKTSKQIATKYYAEQLKTLKDEYTDKINGELFKMKHKIRQIGEQSAQGFIDGLKSKKADKAVKKWAKSIIMSVKRELGIHSPSRVFKNTIAGNSVQGFIDGFKERTNKAVNAVKGFTQNAINGANGVISNANSNFIAGNANGFNMGQNSLPVVNNYTFNQTNNSPKSLSRLEIYRQTKNQLNFAKGV